MVANDDPDAKLNFLVTPLTYWKNEKIGKDKAKEIHSGLPGPYHQMKEVSDKWRKLIDSLGIRVTAPSGRLDGEEHGVPLNRWVDSLMSEHYKIIKMCQASEIVKSKSTLERCSATNWSSLSPDSKSETRNICQNSNK